MRVGILTSWRVPCGVYQYSARMADALSQIDDIEPVILAGRADEGRSVPEESSHEVHDVAKIGFWRDDRESILDVDRICLDLNLDVVHASYQSMLFQQHELAKLACMWHREPRPIAITFHDNCQRLDFPYDVFDLKFTHRRGVGQGDVIPFPIEDRRPVVRTFGLGRTRSDLIAAVCQRNGWTFESAASHEPIHGGGQAWRTHDELIDWLRGADAIVLWYDPERLAGSSQAARTAMAARRPVFTNSTEWFSDLPWTIFDTQFDPFLKVRDLDELEGHLRALFARPYVDDNSWDRVARHLVDRYREAGARG